MAALTLNQRVQGSSPCAPTIDIKGSIPLFSMAPGSEKQECLSGVHGRGALDRFDVVSWIDRSRVKMARNMKLRPRRNSLVASAARSIMSWAAGLDPATIRLGRPCPGAEDHFGWLFLA
jgi:hypothetical protein